MRDELARVVAFPQSSTHRRPVEAPTAEPSLGAELAEPVERPRFLASELLRQDWFPRTPLRRTLRWGALAVGAAGTVSVLAVGGAATSALLLAAALAGCALLGALPVAATTRGVGLAVLGTLGAALAGWMRVVESEGSAALLLVGCVSLSASALFFRAAHRTSPLARVLVAVGLGGTGVWLALTGGVDSLVVASLEWQAWTEPLLRFGLGALVAVTLLTFLDPTGHGGAWLAGGAFLAWLALDAAVALGLALSPLGLEAIGGLGEPRGLGTVACPFLAALSAGGLCQVWALVSRPVQESKREAPGQGEPKVS